MITSKFARGLQIQEFRPIVEEADRMDRYMCVRYTDAIRWFESRCDIGEGRKASYAKYYLANEPKIRYEYCEAASPLCSLLF